MDSIQILSKRISECLVVALKSYTHLHVASLGVCCNFISQMSISNKSNHQTAARQTGDYRHRTLENVRSLRDLSTALKIPQTGEGILDSYLGSNFTVNMDGVECINASRGQGSLSSPSTLAVSFVVDNSDNACSRNGW